MIIKLTEEMCGSCWKLLKTDVLPDVKLSEVILTDTNKKKLTHFFEEQKHKKDLIENGYTPINRLLFYGASGTGKTYLARAIANKLEYPILVVNIGTALMQENAMDNIAEIFKLANKLQNCVLFFDECDSIAWTRESNDAGSSLTKKADTEVLFQYLDTLNPNVIFLAATNLMFKLDAAFQRRFDIAFEFRRPNESLDELIVRFKSHKFEVFDDIDPNTKRAVQSRMTNNVKLNYDEVKKIVKRAEKTTLIKLWEAKENNTNTQKYIKNGRYVLNANDIYALVALQMDLKLKFNTTNEIDEIYGEN